MKEVTDIPLDDLRLLRFVTVPFKIYCLYDDLEDDIYEQRVVKILKEVA
ncbi:MAG: hypothetical protein ACYDBV_15420 [Nitrospiria bacterium]